MTIALWIPTLWVAILASKPVGFWIGGGQVDEDRNPYVDGSPADRLVFLVLIFLGLVILLRRQVDWHSLFKNNKWLLIYYLYCGLSVVWADYPFVSFKRWIKEIGNFVMILLVLTEKNPSIAIQAVMVRCAYFLIPLSILTMKYYVTIGMKWNKWTGEAMVCGVTNNKNTLGRLAFVSALFLLWSLKDMRVREKGWFKRIRGGLPEWLVLLMSVAILFKADSATSLVCLLVGVIVFYASRIDWLKSRPKLVGWMACASILISLLVLAVPELREVAANSLGRRGDLTDRTDIWDRSLELKTDPVIGAGFKSVWTTPGGMNLRDELHIAHSHNGYLETYLNGGLIGVIFLMMVLFVVGKKCLRELRYGTRTAHLFAAVFLSGVMYNYTEVGFNNMTLVGFAMWLAGVQYQHVTDTKALGRNTIRQASDAARVEFAAERQLASQ